LAARKVLTGDGIELDCRIGHGLDHDVQSILYKNNTDIDVSVEIRLFVVGFVPSNPTGFPHIAGGY